MFQARTLLVAGTLVFGLWPSCGTAAEPQLLTLADGVVSAAKIGELKTLPLSPGARELRIWPGFESGTILPSSMLQIRVDQAGTATGTLWLYHPNDVKWSSRKSKRQFNRQFQSQCVAVSAGNAVTTCMAKIRKDFDWNALYTKLVLLDVWTNPDQSELPPIHDGVLDGAAIVVEARTSTSYRRYRYSNPQFRDQPAAQKAAQIMKAASEIQPSTD